MKTPRKLGRMLLSENVSVREAARRLHISRNTPKRWMAETELVKPVYPVRANAPSQLDTYKEHLQLWIKADSHRGKQDRRTVKTIHTKAALSALLPE